MRYPLRITENTHDNAIYIADADHKIVAHIIDPKDSEFAQDIVAVLNAWNRNTNSIIKARAA